MEYYNECTPKPYVITYHKNRRLKRMPNLQQMREISALKSQIRFKTAVIIRRIEDLKSEQFELKEKLIHAINNK